MKSPEQIRKRIWELSRDIEMNNYRLDPIDLKVAVIERRTLKWVMEMR